MKKTISLLLFLLLLTNLAWSWEILMEEGFEGSFTPAGWTNQSYGDHEWQQTSSNVHTGECSAFYSGNTSDDNYAFFILPVIYPPSLNKPVQLVYWEYVENPGDYEQLQIIFTEIPQDFHSWTTLDAYNGVETWTEKTCGIPAQFNDNDNFQIGFKYRERTGSLPPVWYIDNVRIETLPRNAPGLPHDPIPADGATDISTTGTLEWQFGSYTDNYVLWFGEKDNMSQGFYENAHTYSPYSYSVLNSGTEYEWQIISYNHDNLTTEGPVWSFTTESGAITSFPYTEGFENWSGSPFAPVGWTVLDLNLDGTWGKGTSSPHSGSSKAYSSGGEDDWLITPQFGLYDATGYNLKWWDKTSFSNDYEVLVSTETNDHEVFLEEALGTYNM